MNEVALPWGVELRPLQPHADARGSLTELFREAWCGLRARQWNLLRSEPGVLRGVHVHPHHDDYVTVLAGRVTLGLKDLRRESPTAGLAALVEMDGERPAGLVVPHGVAHGLYSAELSVLLLGASEYFDPDDELRCHWSDPGLGLAWPAGPRLVSAADEGAPPLARLIEELSRRAVAARA